MSFLLDYFNGVENKKNNNFTISVAETVTAGSLSNSLCSDIDICKIFKGGIVSGDVHNMIKQLNINSKYKDTDILNPFLSYDIAKNVTKLFSSRIGMATTGFSLPTVIDINEIDNKPLNPQKDKIEIKVPFAYICLYDSKTEEQITKKINIEYNNTISTQLNKASMQAKVAIEGKKIYEKYKKLNDL